MTSEQNTGTPGPARRRRMTGYTPLAENTPEVTDRPQADPQVPTSAPSPTQETSPTPAPSPSVSAEPAPEAEIAADTAQPAAAAPAASAPAAAEQGPAAPAAPVRRRRMSGAPAPLPPTTPVTPAAEATPEAASAADQAGAAKREQSTPAPRRKRMGASSGAAVAAPTTSEAPDASHATAHGAPAGADATSDTAAPKRTRMGGGGSAAAAPAAASPAESAAPKRQRMGGGPPAAGSATTEQQGATTPAAPTAAASTAASATTAASSAQPAPAGKAAATGATTAKGKPAETAERPAWVKPALIIGGLVVVAALVVLGARWLRTLEGVQEFIATYDGHSTQPEAAPVGVPWWMGWQHFFNMFLMVLIVRTGLQVRMERKPPGYWTAKKDSFFSPKGNTPKKVSLSQWLHQSLDVLWVVNGLIFIILLFVSGQWMRIVPTDWDIFPNMLSGAIQYASLDWPTENGWVHYNALQVMAYFITVFIAAPLAIISGLRFSTWWPEKAEKLSKIYPIEWARAIHFPVMLYFVAFTIVHVFLVFFTGALANLNHMYTSRETTDWWGLVIFLVSVVVIAAGWFLSKPMFTTPIAQKMGKISK